MRVRSRFFLRSREGERRVRRRFLVCPRCFGGDWRFLEWAFVVEEVLKVDVGGWCGWGYYSWRWVEVGFTEDCGAVEVE